MNLEEALKSLEIRDSLELLQPHWEESAAGRPAQGPSFLDPTECTASRAWVGLPAEVDPLLLETARRVREDPALLQLAWRCYRLLFAHPEYPADHIARWPTLEKSLADRSGGFYLLIALGLVPLTHAVHQARGVPEAVTRETCASPFEELTRLYRETHGGAWGAMRRVLYWLRHYTAGELYRLGRFEYMVWPFHGPVQAFRHRATGEVLVLAEDGVWFDQEGHARAGAAAEGWTARLVADEEKVTGYPISPAGVAIYREVQLPLDRWQRVLVKEDPVIEVHIPFGGGMTPERCADSMRQALEFFPRYFPERPFVGFTCGSWILNPDLAEFYSPTSNMVLWQRELYLFPWPSNGKAGLFFLFGEDDVDLTTAPRDTSIRRAVLDHLAAGRPLRNGGMFLLTEDFPHFGTQYYRSHWPPAGIGEW